MICKEDDRSARYPLFFLFALLTKKVAEVNQTCTDLQPPAPTRRLSQLLK